MGDYEAYTVSKENVEDDRALLTSGVIGTGTAVEKQPILDRYTHTKYIHIKSTTVDVPSSEFGLYHLLSGQRVSPFPGTKGGGGHTRQGVRGWGSPNSNDWRKA